MATIAYTSNGTVSGKLVITWAGLGAGDTGQVVKAQGPRPLAGAVQITGAFGGTVTLQKSNNGTDWVSVYDLDGTEITVTAAAFFEFSTAANCLRVVSGAGVSNVDVMLVLRG